MKKALAMAVSIVLVMTLVIFIGISILFGTELVQFFSGQKNRHACG